MSYQFFNKTSPTKSLEQLWKQLEEVDVEYKQKKVLEENFRNYIQREYGYKTNKVTRIINILGITLLILVFIFFAKAQLVPAFIILVFALIFIAFSCAKTPALSKNDQTTYRKAQKKLCDLEAEIQKQLKCHGQLLTQLHRETTQNKPIQNEITTPELQTEMPETTQLISNYQFTPTSDLDATEANKQPFRAPKPIPV